MTRLAQQYPGVRYVSLDLERPAVIRGCVTRLPLRSASFDVVICLHVLEHVADDATALQEMRRVIRPGGTLLLQVPERSGATIEGAGNSDEERQRLFGQKDHVRAYGTDVVDRVVRAGLDARRFPAAGERSAALARLHGLRPGQTLLVCKRTPDGVR